MKIPSEVKVAGIIYRVRFYDVVEIDGKSTFLGSCDYAQNEIRIKRGLSQTRAEQVFVHELTHAILFEAGFGDHDEDLVERFSTVAHQVISDNSLTEYDKVAVETKGERAFETGN